MPRAASWGIVLGVLLGSERAVTIAAAVAGPASNVTSTTVAFRLLAGSDILVPVFVNGRGPYQFLLDTGSARSAIVTTLMTRSRPSFRPSTTMVTPTGEQIRTVVEVEELAIGHLPASRADVMLLAAGTLPHAAQGIVGQDVLGLFSYTIDYSRRLFIWHRAPPGTGGTRLPLIWDNGRVLVSLRQAGTGEPLELVPDSGADGWVLVARRGRRLPPNTPHGDAGVRTLAGRRVARGVMVQAVDIGAIQLRNQMAVLIEDERGHGLLGDGLLPLHLFARVTFDHVERTLTVER